jgi:hypothetical protein
MMTAIAIAPRMYSNIMDKPSQFVASAKVKRSDREGSNANRDIDHVEDKDGHWVILFDASLATCKSTFDKMLS